MRKRVKIGVEDFHFDVFPFFRVPAIHWLFGVLVKQFDCAAKLVYMF